MCRISQDIGPHQFRTLQFCRVDGTIETSDRGKTGRFFRPDGRRVATMDLGETGEKVHASIRGQFSDIVPSPYGTTHVHGTVTSAVLTDGGMRGPVGRVFVVIAGRTLNGQTKGVTIVGATNHTFQFVLILSYGFGPWRIRIVRS